MAYLVGGTHRWKLMLSVDLQLSMHLCVRASMCVLYIICEAFQVELEFLSRTANYRILYNIFFLSLQEHDRILKELCHYKRRVVTKN